MRDHPPSLGVVSSQFYLSTSVSFQVNAINAEMDGGSTLPATPPSQPSSTILSEAGQGSGVTQNKGAAFIRESSLTPESRKVSSSAKGDILLLGTEVIPAPPNVQAHSGAHNTPGANTPRPADAYTVLDESTNKTHKSVTGKRSRTSPSKKAARKLFRDEDITDDDAAGSTDANAE